MDLSPDLRTGSGVRPPGGNLEISGSGRRLFPAAILAILFAPLLLLDGLTVRFHARIEGIGWLYDDVFGPLRDFGGFTAGAVVLAAAALLDPARRRRVIACTLAILLSFLAVQGIKILAGRARPEAASSVLQFTGPWGGVFDDKFGSFPSGHTAGAFTLAAVLAATYPRGRWLFFIVAAGCGLARIAEARHFPTDVYAGALIGISSARILIGLEGKLCDRPPKGSSSSSS